MGPGVFDVRLMCHLLLIQLCMGILVQPCQWALDQYLVDYGAKDGNKKLH